MAELIPRQHRGGDEGAHGEDLGRPGQRALGCCRPRRHEDLDAAVGGGARSPAHELTRRGSRRGTDRTGFAWPSSRALPGCPRSVAEGVIPDHPCPNDGFIQAACCSFRSKRALLPWFVSGGAAPAKGGSVSLVRVRFPGNAQAMGSRSVFSCEPPKRRRS